MKMLMAILAFALSTQVSAEIVELQSQTQFDQLKTTNNKMLVEFYYPTCQWCIRQERVLKKLDESNRITIVKIHTQKFPELYKQMTNKSGVPALVYMEMNDIKREAEYDLTVGYTRMPDLVKFINKNENGD